MTMDTRYLIRIEPDANGRSLTDTDATDVLEHAWSGTAHPTAYSCDNYPREGNRAYVCSVAAGADAIDERLAVRGLAHWFGENMQCAWRTCPNCKNLGADIHDALTSVGSVVRVYLVDAPLAYDLEGRQVVVCPDHMDLVAEVAVPAARYGWIEASVAELARIVAEQAQAV